MDNVAHDLLSTTDAMVWAETFMEIWDDRLDEIDVGLMLCWFANAMAAQEMELNKSAVAAFLQEFESREQDNG